MGRPMALTAERYVASFRCRVLKRKCSAVSLVCPHAHWSHGVALTRSQSIQYLEFDATNNLRLITDYASYELMRL